MRFLSLLLILLATGCGDGSGSRNQKLHLGVAVFTPSITVLAPNSVPVNSVPFTMTISGNNFGTDAIAFWNGMPLHTTFISSGQLMADLSTTDLMFVGLIRVFVRTGGMNSNTVVFDVTPQ